TQLVRRGSRIEDIRAVEARLRAATATRELVRKNLARDRALLAKAAIPRATIDESEARRQSATSEVQALQQQLRELRRGPRREEIETAVAQAGAAELAARLEVERRDRYRLRALTPGTILEIHRDPGEMAGAGTPVVTVADTTHPYVDVFVPQQQLAGIRVGAAATIHVDALDTALGGVIEDVGRRTEFTPHYLFSEEERPNLVVRVRVRIADPEQVLHAGVPGFVNVERAR
ncbi:MAG: HlyD family efflux transporter periplasmic adaptor subunit, partial [Deltaproteobacteria bacterium]|nr:HlyD family efflux transporter periplasmic adaptor subunit [Deltaproteobacteria bacterium]